MLHARQTALELLDPMPNNEAHVPCLCSCSFWFAGFVLVLVVVHAIRSIRRYDFEAMGPKTSLEANGREPYAGNEKEHEHGLGIAHERRGRTRLAD
jgi:hypothetical protein